METQAENNKSFKIFQMAMKKEVISKAMPYKEAVKLRKALYNERKVLLNNNPELASEINVEILLNPIYPEGYSGNIDTKDLPHQVVVQRKNLHFLQSFSDLFDL